MSSRLLLGLAVCPSAACPPRLAGLWGPDPCVFASHMVLASSDAWQAGSVPARVWGRHAKPHASILLRGLPPGATVAPSNPWTADAQGNWSIQVGVAASLANYTLTFSSSSENGGEEAAVTLTDVLFGHTLLCSGQSNMDMKVGCAFGSLLSDRNVKDALAFPEIRYMGNGASGRWASAAGLDYFGAPAVLNMSATCYFAAFHLKRDVPAFEHVPIGLVRSSVAAQTIERFLSPAALEAAGVPAANATSVGCSGQVAHALYDELIVPLFPFVFKALVWYQGEANVACNWPGSSVAPPWQHDYYQRLLPALISSWRTLFNVSFTAVVVQLAAYTNPVGNGAALPDLRAAQQAGAASQPHTGLAYPIDLGDDIRNHYPNRAGCNEFGGIHPRNKTEVGRRVALRLAVLEGIAPDSGAADGPIAASFAPAADGRGGRITFSNARSLRLSPTADCRSIGEIPAPLNASASSCCQTTLQAAGGWEGGGGANNGSWGFPFELQRAASGVYVTARATIIDGATVTLAPLHQNATAGDEGPFVGFRMAWSSFPLCVLTNQNGLPGAPTEMRSTTGSSTADDSSDA